MIILKKIGRFVLALVFVMVAFCIFGAMFGGFGALVSWNWLILKDVLMFWTTPIYVGLRIATWFFAFIFGFTAVYSNEAII